MFGMNQFLDGWVDHMSQAPSPTLFRHFIEEAQGRPPVSMVAACMRSCVTGTTITLNGMKRNRPSHYRICLHPVVLGHGKPYFAGPAAAAPSEGP